MSWKVAAVVGACTGGVFWAVLRRARQTSEAGEWAAATDPVAPAAV
jgi:hypothetical protein